jgi:hypothetical protein
VHFTLDVVLVKERLKSPHHHLFDITLGPITGGVFWNFFEPVCLWIHHLTFLDIVVPIARQMPQ